jgi:hypothetical protein
MNSLKQIKIGSELKLIDWNFMKEKNTKKLLILKISMINLKSNIPRLSEGTCKKII